MNRWASVHENFQLVRHILLYLRLKAPNLCAIKLRHNSFYTSLAFIRISMHSYHRKTF